MTGTEPAFVMGKGKPDDPNSVYNAEELSRHLRDNTAPESLD